MPEPVTARRRCLVSGVMAFAVLFGISVVMPTLWLRTGIVAVGGVMMGYFHALALRDQHTPSRARMLLLMGGWTGFGLGLSLAGMTGSVWLAMPIGGGGGAILVYCWKLAQRIY